MTITVQIETLPEAALDAAAEFSSRWLPIVRASFGPNADARGDLAVVLPPATYDHSDWQRAMVRDLARAHAPSRINFVVGEDDEAVEAAIAYLNDAPGVTGQLLVLTDGVVDG